MIFEERQTNKNLIYLIMKIVEDFDIQKTRKKEEKKRKKKREAMQINEKIIKIRSIKLNVDVKNNENDDMNKLNNDDIEEILLIILSAVEKSNKNDMKN